MIFIGILMMQSLLAQELNIAVAANVSYAIEELKSAFLKTHPDTQIRIILGSSGKLAAQIEHGAPFGLFMAANMAYPQSLHDKGMALNPPRLYARGGLALFSTKEQNLSKGLQLLTESSIQTIAIANPKTAPYGKAAVEALKKADLMDQLGEKFVYAESISQTLSYTFTAAQIGIIAKAALFSEKMQEYKEGKHWIGIDTKYYEPIKQGMVLLQASEKEPMYATFYDFILSQEGQKILSQYGYII